MSKVRRISRLSENIHHAEFPHRHATIETIRSCERGRLEQLVGRPGGVRGAMKVFPERPGTCVVVQIG